MLMYPGRLKTRIAFLQDEELSLRAKKEHCTLSTANAQIPNDELIDSQMQKSSRHSKAL